jgi:hypothetical protein
MEDALVIPWDWVSTGVAIAVFFVVIWFITRDPDKNVGPGGRELPQYDKGPGSQHIPNIVKHDVMLSINVNLEPKDS